MEKEAAIVVLEKHLASSRRAQVEEDWEAGVLTADATTILRYTRASIAGVGAIDSHLYGKVRSKKSYYVLVQYAVGVQGRAQLWVAKI